MGIAGTAIFMTFDRHALITLMKDERMQYVPKIADDIKTEVHTPIKGTYQMKTAQPNHIDQMPPVNIVLVAQNEYGQASKMSIIGVEFLNEGSGVSVDDLVIELQTTFVARDINRWEPVDSVTSQEKGSKKEKTTSLPTAKVPEE